MLCTRKMHRLQTMRRPFWRSLATTSSDIATVELSFKLHEPPQKSQNSPLIVMHGLFGSKTNWQSLSKGFARNLNRPVYALDARNHGQSPANPVHNYISMAEDVRAFIHQHEIRGPIVIGHSMGAKTAMTLALRHPELVKFLVSVDNAPVDAALMSNFPRYMRTMKEIETAQLSKQSEADTMLQSVEEDASIRQFLLTNLRRDSESQKLVWRIPLGILAKSLDYMGDFPYTPDQARFKKPTLFIRGKYSAYVADEMIPLIGRFFPRFQVKDIEAGHWVQAEKPAEFTQVLTQFILDEEESMRERGDVSSSSPSSSSSSHVPPTSHSSTPSSSSSFSSNKQANTQTRLFSSSRMAQYEHSPTTLTDHAYFKLADASLNLILTRLEEEADRNAVLDVEYSDGVMNVAIEQIGTYVINRQPPSKQIWLSSPISGPKRFDYVAQQGWVYKDGTQLRDLLHAEWREAGIQVDLHELGLRDDIEAP